jgi:hypothetical protein
MKLLLLLQMSDSQPLRRLPWDLGRRETSDGSSDVLWRIGIGNRELLESLQLLLLSLRWLCSVSLLR